MNGVELAVQQRVEALKSLNPGFFIDWAVADGVWGFITISRNGCIMGFEFVESKTS